MSAAPEKISILHDEYHARYIGRTSDGSQFFEEDGDEWCVEFHPGNFMAFYPPWDGDYDT
jgi:hypothetical protein